MAKVSTYNEDVDYIRWSALVSIGAAETVLGEG